MPDKLAGLARSGPAIPVILMLFVPTHLAAQALPSSALVNQQAEETVEAARAASPHTSEETLAYFADDVDETLADALERVWDPRRPREPSPRTSWGDPDLSGYWVSVAYTPLERPDELDDQAFFTVQEAIEAFQRAVLTDASVDPATVHYDWTEFGMDNWQSPIPPNVRTALIIDPPDGKLPSLTPEGQARMMAQARGHTLESRDTYERCIISAELPRVPFTQQIGESQIVQTPDHIVLLTQANSDVRVIPIDGRDPPPESVRKWLGASRGHWEGETLVVETSNFHNGRKWRGTAGGLQLVERFTRVADDTLLYEVTIDDPTTWEAPWTVEVPWPTLDPPGLFEFACHEQNYGIINVVRGARIRAAEYEASR